MCGAIIGDIVGSKYEFRPIKTKEFLFVSRGCEFTDDTVMTVAVARELLKTREVAAQGEAASFRESLVREMQGLGRRFSDTMPTAVYWHANRTMERPCRPTNTTARGAS